MLYASTPYACSQPGELESSVQRVSERATPAASLPSVRVGPSAVSGKFPSIY